MEIKQGILPEERNKIINWAYTYFSKLTTKSYFIALINQETNWDISAKLVNSDGDILGVYLLGDQQLSSLMANTEYDLLNGVEGVLLTV